MTSLLNKINLTNAALASIVALLLLTVGCDSDSKPSSEAKATPAASELQTGRFALQKMLAPARFWAPDAQPVRLESSNIKDSNGHDGKANFWRAQFASVSRQKSEPFSWSGVSSPDVQRGVDHGAEDSYNPANRSARTFDLNFLHADTDKAFEVAQQHGGKQVLEKDPKVGVTYLLDWDAQSSQLRWHVMYGGETISKLTVLVDASSGEYIRKE
ncbi:MAG TPA: hypothetical protein VKH81_20815 [Candidatus Angelobacter sp.]|nr:hypothetical protein [Candidatus Angelobacter sp.]